MSEIKELFNVQNYNLIQDEDNYYFFRALNNGDHNDMLTGVTRNETGDLTKIRTDRERYIENSENPEPIYKEDEPVSVLQVIDHVKRGHRYDTNCISISSNANVSVLYGNGDYSDEYVIIRVPKNKFGKTTLDSDDLTCARASTIISDLVKEKQSAIIKENRGDNK